MTPKKKAAKAARKAKAVRNLPPQQDPNGGFLVQEAMAGLKVMGEVLSNVSKTRSEISMTFARNARA